MGGALWVTNPVRPGLTLAGRVRFPLQPVTAPGTDPGSAAAAVANPAGVRTTNSLAGSTTDGPNKFNQLTPDGNLT
jgi:hypothetical protein